MTREIPLTQGFVALIDDSDYERVNAKKWFAMKHGRSGVYAGRWEFLPERRLIKMHRFIIDAPAGRLVDHINGQTLDNRRANLRFASCRENASNRRGRDGCFKGIWRYAGRFRAGITVNSKSVHLGYFSTEIEAALAYDAAARRFFGEFARLNFPDGVVA